MKKLIIVLLLLSIINTTYSYNLPDKNQKIVDNLNQKVLKIYQKNPNKAYDMVDKINNLLPKYIDKSIIYYSLTKILKFSEDYIYTYELSKKNNENEINNTNTGVLISENNNEPFVAQIDIDIKNKQNSLNLFDKINLTNISSFEIEAKMDHLYLKNIYLKNIGNIGDITGLFGEVYLVNSLNKIVSKGYVANNYFYFDLNDYIVKRNTLEKFYVFSYINTPENNNQVGELILDFSSPLDAPDNTSNGLRATSYSNGSFISSSTNILDPIKTLISKSKLGIFIDNDFIPSFGNSIGFLLKNNGKEQIELKNFTFQLNGGFLTNLSDTTQFILKRKGSNLVYGIATKADIVNGLITINHTGNDFNYISAYITSEYVLEINHVGNPEGFREIILNNISVGDGFGGTIDNMNNYNYFGLPSKAVDYRYN